MEQTQGQFVDLVYEAKLVDNLRERASLLHYAENDPILRACIIRKCKEDPKYFFETFLYTVKNSIFFSDLMPTDIPFKLFDYQEEMVDTIWYAITRQRNVFIEKSRQMSVTWVVLGLYLYWFLFHNHRYLIISRTANEVDHRGDMKSCFERLRYMMGMLPSWILPDWFDRKSGGENNKYMSINRPDWVGSISGETANSDAGRGGTYTSVFMDEMAFMKDGKTINNAVSSATPCRIMNSTPNGEANEYFEMRKMARTFANLPFDQRPIIGIKLLWDLHPYYTEEWYNWYTASKTEEQIQQELLINYNVSLEGRVYKEFDQAPIGRVDFWDYDYDYSLPFYVSIDNSHGGADPHALICAQTDKYGKIRIFDSLQSNLTPTDFANFLAGRPTVRLNQSELEFMERFSQYKTPVFIADPNDSDASMDKTSIRKIYKWVGIHIVTPKLIQAKGKGRVETQVQLVKQNMDRFQVNIPQCDEFISAIQNATYPKRSEDSQATTANTVPVHNWTSHYRTALEYLTMYICENEWKIWKRETTVEVADPVTWELRKKLLSLSS